MLSLEEESDDSVVPMRALGLPLAMPAPVSTTLQPTAVSSARLAAAAERAPSPPPYSYPHRTVTGAPPTATETYFEPDEALVASKGPAVAAAEHIGALAQISGRLHAAALGLMAVMPPTDCLRMIVALDNAASVATPYLACIGCSSFPEDAALLFFICLGDQGTGTAASIRIATVLPLTRDLQVRVAGDSALVLISGTCTLVSRFASLSALGATRSFLGEILLLASAVDQNPADQPWLAGYRRIADPVAERVFTPKGTERIGEETSAQGAVDPRRGLEPDDERDMRQALRRALRSSDAYSKNGTELAKRLRQSLGKRCERGFRAFAADER
jgi:hypothetical protein